MNNRTPLVAVTQSGASTVRRGRSTKRYTTMRITPATSEIVALMRIYSTALDDGDCSDKLPTLLRYSLVVLTLIFIG
jgi:hypothetical protein